MTSIEMGYALNRYHLGVFDCTSGSAARHPSLYLALRARPWLRMSQSYDISDVDTTLLLFAAATVLAAS